MLAPQADRAEPAEPLELERPLQFLNFEQTRFSLVALFSSQLLQTVKMSEKTPDHFFTICRHSRRKIPALMGSDFNTLSMSL